MRKETIQNFPDFDKMSLKVEQATVEMVVFFPSVSRCAEFEITSLTEFILNIDSCVNNEVCKFSLCLLLLK